MKHIKLFENFRNSELHLKFSDNDEFKKAIEFFENHSVFNIDDINHEFKTLIFECDNDKDITEKEIDNELINNGFNNYYFES